MEPVLTVANLTVKFGELTVLDDLSFSINKGDLLLVLGPNGAGKTVLLKTILGILIPTDGEVKVFGQSVDGVKSKIGYVPQYVNIDQTFPLTVAEVVGLGLGGRKLKNPARRITRYLKMTEMADKQDKFFGDLSGGQRKRVLIAKALVARPKLLLLDEPLAGVDVSGERDFFDLVKKWHREMELTTVMISHDITLVKKMASKVLCLNGRKLCFGPVSHLTTEKFEEVFGRDVLVHKH